MIVASITRETGDLLIATENHPKTGESIIVISHVRPDETVICRSPLRVGEIKQVVAALELAAKTLTAKRAQHRTLTAAEHMAEERKLF